MRLLLTLASIAATLSAVNVHAETFNINGTDYEAGLLIRRDIGPGTTYMRYRIPDYPLNVNIVTMDLDNPYNRIETMQGNDIAGKTETLESAAERYTSPGHKAIAGANGNFWCVTSQNPWSDLLVGVTFGGNVRNSQIITETNDYSDQWCGGSANTGIIAIDKDKRIFCESMWWKGYVINEKIGNPEIIQVNKVVRDNEIGLYNSFFGRDKKFQPVDQYNNDSGQAHWNIVEGVSTEVYLDIDEGQEWVVGQDMTCTVKKVVAMAGTGTLGEYDLALVGRGTNRDLLARLAEGDKVTISHGWTSFETNEKPQIENLMQALSIVMKDGVKDEAANGNSYNGMVYSRTGYGSSADGKTLYMIVVDKSTDPVYGASAGCTTSDLCDIIRHFGCVNLAAMDGGGSAQMMIQGKVINKTTESYPRAVANGWMAYSIAPEDNIIARLEFNDVDLYAPVYSYSTPRVLGYNRYGDLIDENVTGLTFTCDENIGTCDGDVFIAGANSATGEITAHLGDISVTKEINVVNADLSIRLKPILIDASREYPVEVTADVNSNIYVYDPANIDWTTEDPGICSVDSRGVLHGLKNGSTKITATIGDFVDETTVNVEIADRPQIAHAPWDTWTAKGASGITSAAISDDGLLSFKYGSPRDAYVQISNDFQIYSIPQKITLSFTPSVALESITADIRTRSHDRQNLVKIFPQGDGAVFASGVTHTVEFPISECGDIDDLATYPLSVKYIKFQIQKSSEYKGDQNIRLGEFVAHYDNFTEGMDNISAPMKSYTHIYPNPASSGSTVFVSANTEITGIRIYSQSGSLVASGQGSSIKSPSVPGLYIVRIATASGDETARLIVR